MSEKKFGILRNSPWHQGNPRDAFMHRSWMRRGYPDSAFSGKKPQIAIINTASDFSPCNAHLGELAQSVKNGVWAADGPLGLVRNGDMMILNVAARVIAIDISVEESNSRLPLAGDKTGYARPLRGYERLYIDHLIQAPTGADFGFLFGSSGASIPCESH
jgi:dihydroxyacid dehydratase/phosphogluconate dehydratase